MADWGTLHKLVCKAYEAMPGHYIIADRNSLGVTTLRATTEKPLDYPPKGRLCPQTGEFLPAISTGPDLREPPTAPPSNQQTKGATMTEAQAMERDRRVSEACGMLRSSVAAVSELIGPETARLIADHEATMAKKESDKVASFRRILEVMQGEKTIHEAAKECEATKPQRPAPHGTPQPNQTEPSRPETGRPEQNQCGAEPPPESQKIKSDSEKTRRIYLDEHEFRAIACTLAMLRGACAALPVEMFSLFNDEAGEAVAILRTAAIR